MKRMRMIALLALASLALLLTAAACSDDEDDDTGDAATTTEASDDSSSDDGAADADASADDADGDADDAAEDGDAAADDAAGDDSSTDATAPDTAATGTITGSISDFTFAIPTEATVGTTIDWTNDDEFPHTVTQKDGGFDSGSIVVGGTFSHTLDTAGTVNIFCTIHPFMTATIEVVEG